MLGKFLKSILFFIEVIEEIKCIYGGVGSYFGIMEGEFLFENGVILKENRVLVRDLILIVLC